MQAKPPLTYPPKARLAFRVGVVGHRPDRLPSEASGLSDVRARLAQALESVAEAVNAFAAGPGGALYNVGERPILRVNSPLAEGADRLFAEEALRLGYSLNCVMPFAQAEFERDFVEPDSIEPRSLERFRGILATAEAAGVLHVFEMDGRRERAREAYEAAGRVVLNHCDLLIVVWDGRAHGGVGGTLDSLREAIEFRVPALWIDTRAPHGWRLFRPGDSVEITNGDFLPGPAVESTEALRAALAEVVEAELGLPAGPDGVATETAHHLAAYFRERRPALNLALTWKMFRDFMDLDLMRLPKVRVAPFEDQIRDAWPTAEDAAVSGDAPSASVSWINSGLRAHYAWSDKLADLYADAHRSGFVMSSLLASLAVFTALLPVAGNFDRQASIVTALVEAGFLALMVGLPTAARRGRWHQKWMEYRVLAELVRELRILSPLGGARPQPRTSAHLASYGDPTRSWMYWQVRAIAREIGLPQARVDAAYVGEQLANLAEFVGQGDKSGGQLGFHERNFERMERIHHRLHRLALILFAVTLVAVVLNWLIRLTVPEAPERLTAWIILFSAFLPALGAAMASINNQGEFARLQRRSRAMAESLKEIADRIGVLVSAETPPRLAGVTELAMEISAMMVDENTDWRIVVLDLPHAAG